MQRELTGRHVLAIFVVSFGIIIAVNIALAWSAIATFPGIEVSNGYVASQSFDAERKAQIALGWQADTRLEDGLLRVTFTGADGRPPDNIATVEGAFGRATESLEDQAPDFLRIRQATFEAPVKAGRGQWVLQLRAHATDGTLFRQRVSIAVGE